MDVDVLIPTVGDLVYTGIQATDAVFASASRDISAIVRDLPQEVTAADKATAMRRIDQVLDRSFGTTQPRAKASDLYGAIVQARTRAVNAPYDEAANWIGKVLRNDQLYRGLYGPVVEAQRANRASLFDPERRWVRGDPYRLSDRVWRQGRRMREQIDTVIQDGIRQGMSADRLARQLERYIDPSHAPTRWSRSGVHKRSIKRDPYAASSARRLARTEIMHAHGMATIQATKDTPGSIGVKWVLSGSHPEPDICNSKASQDRYNLGPGVYPVDNVPPYPTHPNELCHLQSVMGSREDTLDAIVREFAGQPIDQPPVRQLVSFTPAKSTAEAQRYAKDRLGIDHASYRNTKDANFINRTLTDLHNSGVDVRFTNIQSIPQGRAQGSPTASFRGQEQRVLRQRNGEPLIQQPTRTMTINTDDPYWRNPEQWAKKNSDTRWWVESDPGVVLVHETAHKVHYEHLLRTTGSDKAWEQGVRRASLRDQVSADDLNRISNEVSTYATTNQAEVVAEMWTGYYYGKTYTDELMALYRRFDGPPLVRRNPAP